MRLIQEKGLKLPEDIALIGFTGGMLSCLSTSTLSVLTRQGEPMGAIAAPILLDKPEDSATVNFRTGVLPVTLTEPKSATKQKSHHI